MNGITIERLARELCEKSGCHHKCHDTKDCVVEDEALLLINENKSNNSDFKSNNFEVKSNEELFKQALVEGLNRHFDKTIEEAKKIEQIEEMIEIVKPFVSGLACEEESGSCELTDCRSCNARDLSNKLYTAGYRKQEWISVEDRLPDKYKSVLISCEDEVRIDYIDAYGFWHDNYPYRVTHWMPLPEAPKMKGGA